MEDLLKVGVITTTHGVRGEVKELRRLDIKNVRFFKNLVILKFDGIDNINDIEKYKGRDLWIPREEAQELDEDEYYIADLLGMKVLLEDGSEFGTLKNVMETGVPFLRHGSMTFLTGSMSLVGVGFVRIPLHC